MANTRSHSGNILDRLPPELLAEIHGRLGLVDCFSFLVACGASSRRHLLLLKPEPPCLLLPGSTPGMSTLFSLSDRGDATAPAAPAPDPSTVVLGSSAGWLVTAGAREQLMMTNPVTGDQVDLPAITTIPFIRRKESTHSFLVDVEPFLQMRRFSGGSPLIRPKATASSLPAEQFRSSFYHKVVLSGSPRSGEGYVAMLILNRQYGGAPAFATAEHSAWRLAPFHDTVEDAIYHGGRFYSVTYSSVVESWHRHGDTGEFTSKTVAPRLACQDQYHYYKRHRKYLAAAPDGRLMAVHKHQRSCVFTVQALDEERGQWKETKDIGDAALFVGVNSSMCVPAGEHHPGIVRAGCVYFTNDQLDQAYLDWNLLRRYGSANSGYGVELRDRDVGVLSLKDGKVEKLVDGLGRRHLFWPLPAWFTPSIS